MRGMIRKLNILRLFLIGAFSEWRREIWPNDLDSQYCCGGRECGCFGATYYDIYGPQKPIKVSEQDE